MLIILTAGTLVMALCLAYVWHLCIKAPEGTEDEAGFHYSAKAEIALKTASAERPVALKSHNDHEPIAA